MGIESSSPKIEQRTIYNESYVRPKPKEYITILCFSFDQYFKMDLFESEILSEAVLQNIINENFENLSSIKLSHSINIKNICGALNFLVSFKSSCLTSNQLQRFEEGINKRIKKTFGKCKFWKTIQIPRNFMPHSSYSFREFRCVLPKTLFKHDSSFLQSTLDDVVLPKLCTTDKYSVFSKTQNGECIYDIKILQNHFSLNEIFLVRGIISDVNLVLGILPLIICFLNQNINLQYIEKALSDKHVKLPKHLPSQCCYFDHSDYSAFMMVSRFGLPPEKQNVNFTNLTPSMHQWCQHNIMPNIEEFLGSNEFNDYRKNLLSFSG